MKVELGATNAPFPGAVDGPLDLKPATVSAWSSYLAAHQAPSCASTRVIKDYGALQASVVFLKGDVTLYNLQGS